MARILCLSWEFEIDSEEIFRTVAGIYVVVAAITLIIPILHRLGRFDSNEEELLMLVHVRNILLMDR